MEKKNLDWANIGFGYIKTDKRYVANYTNGAWDEGTLTEDDMITMSECAGVLQYAQTVFEGLKAYTTESGHIVTFRPDLNGERLENSAKRLEMPVFPRNVLYRQSLRLSVPTKHMCRRLDQAPHYISARTCSVLTRS